jgi:hypothetical protein
MMVEQIGRFVIPGMHPIGSYKGIWAFRDLVDDINARTKSLSNEELARGLEKLRSIKASGIEKVYISEFGGEEVSLATWSVVVWVDGLIEKYSSSLGTRKLVPPGVLVPPAETAPGIGRMVLFGTAIVALWWMLKREEHKAAARAITEELRGI